MKPRFFVLIFTWCTVGFSTAVWALGNGSNKPNIIVILTDDHGWSDLGAQGVRKDIQTPNLDSLATGGLRAVQGYITAPQCVPSRAGLLSGRYQNRFGVESNKESVVPFLEQRTIAERLQQAGYVTGMAGKWHLGDEKKITDHGFDKAFFKHSNAPGYWNMNLEGREIQPSEQRGGGYHLDLISDFACAFIARYSDRPFFFYLAPRAPHTPLDAPKKYTDRFPGEMPERRRQALSMISAVDDGVGRILDTLRDHRIEEKTMIFVMGDNGAPLKISKTDSPLQGDPGGWDGSLNEPLNGEKGMLSEGGIRTPWLAYWKGTIPGGQIYEHPVISLDIAATAVALAGLETNPQELDGVNLLPYWTGRNREAPHRQLYWRWTSQSAIRDGKWKLLRGGSREYLFDLQADPGEKHNLINQYPDIATSLRQQLRTWGSELTPPGVDTPTLSQAATNYFDFYLDGMPILPSKISTDSKNSANRREQRKQQRQKAIQNDPPRDKP